MNMLASQAVDKQVDFVCPFCGVGCLVSYKVRDNTIVAVEGRDGPANQSRLCVKGRFGFDYAHSPQRLTLPLIRKAGVAKDAATLQTLNRNPSDWSQVFREASWDEALAFAAGGPSGLREKHGNKALAVSARPRAATKKPICSRSWCAPVLAQTTWTIAPACAIHPALRRCSKAWVQAQ